MPYVYDPNLDSDDEENQGVASGAPPTKLSGASSTSEATSGISSAAPKEKLNTGSGYQNLDKYLDTNQSQQFGQQVLDKVSGTLDTAKQNQADASNQFKNQVNQANDTPDGERINQALERPEEANAQEFQKWMSQSYQGPKSLGETQDNWNKYWSGTNQANTNAKLLGSEAGRFSLLDSYFGRPQYNFGEKSLDNLLIQGSGTGRQTRALQNQAAQLKSQGEQQAKNLQGFAAQRAGQVDESRNQVNQSFNQAQTQAQDVINQSLTQAQADQLAEQQSIRSNLSQAQATQDQLARLGLSSGQNIYNLNLENYLTTSPSLTREQVASDEQRARLNALSQLSGQEQTFLGEKQNLSSPYEFDTNRFQTDLGSSQSQYSQALGNAMNIVRDYAPFDGNYLNSLNSNSNPVEVMNRINQETVMWQQEKANGNPYADSRLNNLNISRNALMSALNQYNVNPSTGQIRSLRGV